MLIRKWIRLTAGGVIVPVLALGALAADMTRDVAKGVVERPSKTILARTAEQPADYTDNPRVQPGLVHWHRTMAAAQEAARKSGKPVLLFQMMGRLDQRFC